MEVESSASMSMVDVADVAASLEHAATKVKQLNQIAGVHEVKTSVDLLTAQVQTLHGTVSKHHADVMEAWTKLARIHML